MENGKKEFLGTLCNIYMILLLVLLPLYTGGGYYKLGDSKYLLFRNVSLFCQSIWLLVTIASMIGNLTAKGRQTRKTTQMGYVQQDGRMRSRKWSSVDLAVLSYGISAFLSAVASPYQQTAWTGYLDWYMGALTQILLVGIYFLVSREYMRTVYPVRAGELGLLLVVFIAFLQRLGVDILQLQSSFSSADWEYSHMLSTIGNINWLCGYLCVLLPWPVVGFFYSSKRGRRIVYYIVSVLALTLMLTQGSDTGILLVLVCLGLGALHGSRRPEVFRKSVLLALGICALCPVLGFLMKHLGTWDMLAVDGFLTALMTEWFWWVLAALLCGVSLLQRRLPHKWVIWLNRSLLIGAGVFAVGFVATYLCGLPRGETWGSGRGGLWQAAWRGFADAKLPRKLIGFGPDCFAEYIYGTPSLAERIQMEGHWEHSVFANAHNEWLNMLINGGVLGAVSYAGVFACGLRRYRGMLLGVMVLVLYFVNSLFSFQQVVSTPFLFLVLGICESRYRTGVRTI